MIKQIMNGRSINVVMVTGSTADLGALALLLEGQSEVYKTGASGGTPSAITNLNSYKFSVGKIGSMGARKSAPVNLPHMKKTKDFSDVKAFCIGAFDADLITTEKATYCNGIGSSYKG